MCIHVYTTYRAWVCKLFERKAAFLNCLLHKHVCISFCIASQQLKTLRIFQIAICRKLAAKQRDVYMRDSRALQVSQKCDFLFLLQKVLVPSESRPLKPKSSILITAQLIRRCKYLPQNTSPSPELQSRIILTWEKNYGTPRVRLTLSLSSTCSFTLCVSIHETIGYVEMEEGCNSDY